MKNKAAFTLIEILVVVGVLTVLVVSVGGIMGMTFKAKNSSEGNELLSSKAVYVLTELKRNILNADVNRIICPTGVGTSISFTAKDSIKTTLKCIESPTYQIASISAVGAVEVPYYLLDNGVSTTPGGCSSFVECDSNGAVKFTLKIEAPKNAAGAGTSGVYYGVAVPRE